MEEIVIKVDIPLEFKEEFRIALAKVVEEFIKKIRLMELGQLMEELSSKEEQELIDQSVKLGKKVNESLHKRYKKLYPKLE
jgi:hypothetical protein